MLQKHAPGFSAGAWVLHFSPSAMVPLQSQKSPEMELRVKASIPAVGGYYLPCWCSSHPVNMPAVQEAWQSFHSMSQISLLQLKLSKDHTVPILVKENIQPGAQILTAGLTPRCMLDLSCPQSPFSPDPRPNFLPSCKLAKATSSLGVALLPSWIDYSPDLSSMTFCFSGFKNSSTQCSSHFVQCLFLFIHGVG